MELDYGYTIQIESDGTSNPPVVPTNQWQRKLKGQSDYTDIAGATGITYTVTANDQGTDIRLVQIFDGVRGGSNTTTVTNSPPPTVLDENQLELTAGPLRILGQTIGSGYIIGPTGQKDYCSDVFDYTYTILGVYTLPMNVMRALRFTPGSNIAEMRFSPIFNTSFVQDMSQMFYSCKLFDSDISNWDTSNVSNMNSQFMNCTAFNQDLSSWCVEKIGTKPQFFDTDSGFENETALQPKWGDPC